MTVQALRRGRPEVLAELLDRYGRDMQAVALAALLLPIAAGCAQVLRTYGRLHPPVTLEGSVAVPAASAARQTPRL